MFKGAVMLAGLTGMRMTRLAGTGSATTPPHP